MLVVMKVTEIQIGNYYRTAISGKAVTVFVCGYGIDYEEIGNTGKIRKVTTFNVVRAGAFDGVVFRRRAARLHVCADTRAKAGATLPADWKEVEVSV